MRATARAAVLAIGVIVVDQATKAIVRGSIVRGDSHHVLPGIHLVNSRNTGVAFGLFGNGGALVTVITIAALAGLLIFFARNVDRPLAWLPTGLLIGGAIGNMIDRLSGEGVTDFVKLPDWPAFNVADVCITFGVISLVYVLEKPRARA
jgi:signal peptidase II